MANIVVKLKEKKNADACILLGKQLEKTVETVSFDFSEWKAEYGSGTISAYVLRPQDDTAYPVALTVVGNIASMSVTQTEVEKSGHGSLELQYVFDGHICRSETYRTYVIPSIASAVGSVPSGFENWVTRLETLGESAEGYCERTEEAILHQPKIDADSKHWLVWDNDTEAYADTGISAQGLGSVNDVKVNGTSVVADGVANIDISGKQDKLIAGDNITIAEDGKTISASGGGGGGGITDVKINGSSIVTDGVANVPILTPSQWNGMYGAVELASPYRISVRKDIYNYSKQAIPIDCVDDLVRYAMCDGIGSAWSDSEKANARARLGAVGEYVSLADVTLTEDVGTIDIPFNASVSELEIEMYTKGVTVGASLYVFGNDSNAYRIASSNGNMNTTDEYCRIQIKQRVDEYPYSYSAKAGLQGQANVVIFNPDIPFCAKFPLTTIRIAMQGNALIKSGTRIIVKGVKA